MSRSRMTERPEALRPRETLLARGAAAVSDAGLLALLCRVGRPGLPVDALAEEVLEGAQGLGRLASLSVPQLRKQHRLGQVQAITLVAAFELGRRAARERRDRIKFSDPSAVRSYLREIHADHPQEKTGVLLLDARHRLLREATVYEGTLDRAMVEPRGVLREALLHDAAAVILFHNHPSGDPEPSAEDVEFTRRLLRACEAAGVRLLDHVVVGREGAVSLRERGIF